MIFRVLSKNATPRFRNRRALLLVAVCTLFVLAGPHSASAQDEVAVTVGETKLSVADVERRLRTVPVYQLSAYGSTPEQIRKNFVEKIVVPELLLAEEARRRKLDGSAAVYDRLREVLRQTMDTNLRDTLAEKEPVTEAELRSYYDQNRARFETPARLRLWRILAPTEDLAKKILNDAKGREGPAKWAELARQHSLDKATNQRSGDLGFVRADGTTDTPRVRVDAALFAAADKVKDGELVPEPVKEGAHFAAIWRRGSLPAVTRTLKDEEPSIRPIVGKMKLEKKRSELLDDLKKRYVKNLDESLLGYVDVSAFGDVAARERPGIVPRHRPRAEPGPPRTRIPVPNPPSGH
jgi:peptidyl-prolyl cis-trans isomerase C